MALLTFPVAPVAGQIYPVNPPAGVNIYQWDSADQTWRLLGASTGVTAGVYGTPLAVPEITVDATGRITFAQNLPIQLGDTTQVGLVQLVDDTISNDATKALTAAQGYKLQNEIGDTSTLNPFYPNLVTAINALGAPTGVGAGTYGNGSNVPQFTVNAQGRITSAVNVPLALATTVAPGVVRVGSNLTVTGTGLLSVPNANTAQRGVVQLVNDTVTNDSTKALTAAAGYNLQQQINALEARNNLTFAGTIDGATGLMLTVTAQGAALGFAVGAALPAPSLANNEYFVVVTVPGTFTPTGGAPQACNDGDWFVSDGSAWIYYNVGPNVATATFIQIDDIASQFNGTRVAFVLRISGAAYAPGSASNILLSVGGVLQVPGTSFTLAGSTVTFSEAPKAGTSFVGYAITGVTGGGGGGGGGTGTVTSVGTGTGLLGGPITTTGTISLRPATTSTLGGVIPDNTTITVSPTGVISASSAGVGTLQAVTNNGSTTTNAITVGGLTSTGNVVIGDSNADIVSVPARVASSLIPSADITYDLGSATNRWRDLYVSSNSIYMGTNQLTVSGGQLLLNGSPVGGGGTVGTLQTVTDNGATTTNNITLDNSDLIVKNGSGNTRIQLSAGASFFSDPVSMASSGPSSQNPILTVGNSNSILWQGGSSQSMRVNNAGVTFGMAGFGITIYGQSVAASSSYSLHLPDAQGAAGTTLVNDGTGQLSWGTGGGSVGTLQQVTDAGATTTNDITTGSIQIGSSTDSATPRYLSLGSSADIVWNNPDITIKNTFNNGDIIFRQPGTWRVDTYQNDPLIVAGGEVRLYYKTTATSTVQRLETTLAGVTISGELTAGGLAYPTTDGAPGEVMTTDGAGNLGWVTTAEVVASPINSATPGTQGQIAFGTGFFYWHDGTQWLRVAGSTF